MLRKDEEDEAEVLASTDAFIDNMVVRRRANDAIVIEMQEKKKEEDGPAGE